VVDHTTADVTHDGAVLVAADPAGDSLLVHDVVTDLRPVNDLAVEAGALIEYPAEVRAQIPVALCEDRASRVFDHAVGREAGDEPVEVSLVVCPDVLGDRIDHALPLGLRLSWGEYAAVHAWPLTREELIEEQPAGHPLACGLAAPTPRRG
jgi:hypothetical protein